MQREVEEEHELQENMSLWKGKRKIKSAREQFREEVYKNAKDE
jgi:hypothetical protein